MKQTIVMLALVLVMASGCRIVYKDVVILKVPAKAGYKSLAIAVNLYNTGEQTVNQTKEVPFDIGRSAKVTAIP